MELLLGLRTVDACADVVVEAEPWHTLDEVVRAAVRGAELAEPARPEPVTVDGAVVDPTVTVAEAGLRSGSEVGAGVPPRACGAPIVVRVSVIGGVDAGLVELLDPGRHVIGRDPAASVALTDARLVPRHAHLDVRIDGAIRVVPADAGDVDVDGCRVDGPCVVSDDSTIRIGSTTLDVAVVDQRRRPDARGRVAHNRSPQTPWLVRSRELPPLPRPPEQPAGSRLALASALAPAASGGVLVAVSGRLEFLLLVLLSPLLLGMHHLRERRSGRRRHAADRADWLDELDDRLLRGRYALADELVERRRAAPPIEAVVRQATLGQPRLWERTRSATDFGELRIGESTSRSRVRVALAEGGDRELAERARVDLAVLDEVAGAPVSLSLAETPVVAVVGAPDDRHDVARAVVARAAALHSPEDLVVVAAIAPSTLADHEWIKWLPHVRPPSSPFDGPATASWPDETDRLLVELAHVVEGRTGDGARPSSAAPPCWPEVLVVLDEAAIPDRAVLARVLDRAGPAGIRVLWVGGHLDGVPQQAGAIVSCGAAGHPSVLRHRDRSGGARDIRVDRLDVSAATVFGRALAPCRDAASAGRSAALPRLVPLHEVLADGRADPARLIEAWQRDRGGLAAAVGVGADGPLVLDLVDDGPHALVAGTSGAGKSELLQAWVASLAVAHPPEHVAFLLIDYKGGAFSGPFVDLPHRVGTVTNLDDALAQRVLVSLRAELDRRMEVLGGDAKDLATLAAIDPEAAPPRLVIVVDEFATLAREVPEFVAGMIDLAERGRSLGIHLVLATQRPSGSVNQQILANTNLRIALRVLDAADSSAIIGVPDAARVPPSRRGRAHVRSGPGRLRSFQSAFGGAPDRRAGDQRSIVATRFDFSGAQGVRELGDGGVVEGSAPTQLEVVVAALAAAHRERGGATPRRPWLEPLPEVVPSADLVPGGDDRVRRVADPGRWVTVGLADRPEDQRQEPWIVDLEASGGLLVVGGGGAGRTTVLRTIAADLARHRGSSGVVVHVVDAAGRAMTSVGGLPVVGSVLGTRSPEPVARLIEVLEDELATRRERLARQHCDALSDLRRGSGSLVPPRIVVLIDGLDALREALDGPESYGWLDRLGRVIADGRSAGIHVVATATRRAGVPGAIAGSLSARLTLRTADPDEAVGLGVPRSVAIGDLPPGRGFADGALVQVAVAGGDPSGPGQAAALGQLAVQTSNQPAAPELPELPEVLAEPQPPAAGLIVDLGRVDLTGSAATVDLSAGDLVVAGPPASGRSTAVELVATALAGSASRVRLVGVGGPTSPLARSTVLSAAHFARDGHGAFLDEIADSIEPGGRGVETVVLIDAVSDLISIETEPALASLVGSASVRLVVAVGGRDLARAFSGWLAEVLRAGHVLLLQPDGRDEIDAVFDRRVALRPAQPLPPGRGLLSHGTATRLVQIRCPVPMNIEKA